MKEALKKFSYVVLGVVIIGLILYGIDRYFFAGRVSTEDARVDSHLVFVGPRISGKVIKVLVHDHELVKPGQPIVLLSPADYKAKLQAAEFNLKRLEKTLAADRLSVPISRISTSGTMNRVGAMLLAAGSNQEKLNRVVAQVRSRIIQLKADLISARSRYDLAKSNYARMKLLIRNYIASQEQYDSFKTQYENAKADLISAKARLASAREELSQQLAALQEVKYQVKAARAQVFAASAGPAQVLMQKQKVAADEQAVKQAEALAHLAKLQLSYTTVKAPVEGIVTRRQVTVGDVVARGQTLLILAPIGKNLWVKADFRETALTQMKPGDKVSIAIDSFPGRVFQGAVNSISGATGAATSLFPPENASGNFVKIVQRVPVKITFNSGQNLKGLLTGMSAEVTIFLHSK